MSIKRFVCFAAALSAFAILTPLASAGVVFYSTQQAYLDAVSNPGVDTYNDLPLSSVNGPLTRTAGNYSYSAAVPGNFFPAGTGADVWLSANSATDTLTFSNFSGEVFGAGAFLFGSDVSGNYLNAVTVNVSVTDASGTYEQATTAFSTSNFLGWVSTSGLQSFSLSATQPAVVFAWPTVNNLTLGATATTATPEPSTILLSALGLAGLTVGRFRRKKA